MLQERQRIEAPPTAAVVSHESSSPPHDESNGVYASHSNGDSVDNSDYYLGEVSVSLCYVYLVSYSFL